MTTKKPKDEDEKADLREIFKQADDSQTLRKGRRPPTYCLDPHLRGAPVDYSFRKVFGMKELEGGTPRQFRVGIPKKAASGRYISSSLWVNSNHLTNLASVDSLVGVSFNRPEIVAWLDASFNDIQHISPEIASLKNLKILYLHGNKIKFFIEVAKLKPLTRLRTLTLHGNPIEEVSNYRATVLKNLPWLVNLDFSVVLKDSYPGGRVRTPKNAERQVAEGAQVPGLPPPEEAPEAEEPHKSKINL